MPRQSSYYDIDAILAEEELIPVTNLLDFSHLVHLDPDYIHQRDTPSNNGASKSNATIPSTSPSQSSITSSITDLNHNPSNTKPPNSRKRRNTAMSFDNNNNNRNNTHLPEHTIFKMPLWSIHKWSELNFIQLSLPKPYNRKGREKLETDPISINLRQKCERYYMSGMALIDLIHRNVQAFDRLNNNSPSSQRREQRRRSNHNSNNTQANLMNKLYNESQELKRTLLLTYTGPRLRQTLNWTMSPNTEDDVSAYTKKLTEMERRLFQLSSEASLACMMWKLYGSHRIHVSEMAMRAKVVMTTSTTTGVNRNLYGMDKENQGNDSGRKMMTKTTTTTTTPGMTRGKRSSSRLISPENEMGNGDNRNYGIRKRMRSYQ